MAACGSKRSFDRSVTLHLAAKVRSPNRENHDIEVELARAERQRRFDQIADGIRALGLHESNAELRMQVDRGKLHKRHAFRPHLTHARWHDSDADGGGDQIDRGRQLRRLLYDARLEVRIRPRLSDAYGSNPA